MKALTGAAMAAVMAAPGVSFAAENISQLENPASGAPILVEHPTTATITNGTGTTIGSGAANNGTAEAVVVGQDATVQKFAGAKDASFDTAIGHKANVTGTSGTAVGSAANVSSAYGGTAVGTASNVQNGQMGTAVGYMSKSDGNFATSVGANAEADKDNSAAFGANSKATAENSVALGDNSVADEANTVSVGSKGATRKITNVTAGTAGTDGVNVSQLKDGLDGKANIDLSNINENGKQVIRDLAGKADVDINSTSGAITVKKEVKDGKTAFDLNLAKDQTFDSVTVNKTKTTNLNVTGDTVIGTNKSNTMTVNATTNFNADVNFNQGANFKGNIDAKSFSVNGDKYITEWGLDAHNHKIVNVADGEVAAGSKDAVNGGQLYNEVNNIRKDIKGDVQDAIKGEVGKVGAQAAAMANLHPLEFDKHDRVSVAASVGAYKDQVAGAVGAFYRPDKDSMISLSGAFGNNDNMYGLGISKKLGHGSNDVVSDMEDVNMAVRDLKDENTGLKNQLADMNGKYQKILDMLAKGSGLPTRVVSEVVVAPIPKDTAVKSDIKADSNGDVSQELSQEESQWYQGDDGLWHEKTVTVNE